MVHTVRPILRGRGGKRMFLVHFVASAECDVYNILVRQVGKRNLRILKQKKRDIQTIEVRIEESRLRHIVDQIPRSVQLAYEEKEPEKC